MKTRFITTAAMVLSLTACNQLSESDKAAEAAANAATPAEEVRPAKEAVSVASTGAFSKDYMIGKWANETDNDCTLAQEFKADGTVDGVFDSWSVSGSELHAVIAGEKMVFAVTVVDEKHLDVVSTEGKKSRVVRC